MPLLREMQVDKAPIIVSALTGLDLDAQMIQRLLDAV